MPAPAPYIARFTHMISLDGQSLRLEVAYLQGTIVEAYVIDPANPERDVDPTQGQWNSLAPFMPDTLAEAVSVLGRG